jgi:hypothetical protein
VSLSALLAAALAADPACAVAAAVAAESGEMAAPVVRGKSTSGDLFTVPLRLVPDLAADVRALLATPDAAAPGDPVDCTATFEAAGVTVGGEATAGWAAYFGRPVIAADGRLAAVYRWAASSEDQIRMDVVITRKDGAAWRVADTYLINMGEP